MRKENCPDNCRYRSYDAPFCGYCMKKILEEESEKKNGNGQADSKDAEQTDRHESGH